MTMQNSIKLCLLLFVLFLFSGCAQYIITQELDQPISHNSPCSIGPITDELPEDFSEEDKPTMEAIDDLKDQLIQCLNKEEIFLGIRRELYEAHYEVTGSILDYKKGSGFLRFMFGFIGSAKITIELRLVDLSSNDVIFSGNFKAAVTSGYASGDEMYKKVARDFAKALKKGLKKLDKERNG